jgi:isoquinoline 1-oxidoreductase beta subunit
LLLFQSPVLLVETSFYLQTAFHSLRLCSKIGPSHREALSPNYDRTQVDGALAEGIGDQGDEIPNLKASVVRADFHIPLAAWRSVISATTAFAHECFID